VDQNSDVSEIAAKMRRNKIGSVVTVENGKVVGIVTERDFVAVIESVAVLDKNRTRHVGVGSNQINEREAR